MGDGPVSDRVHFVVDGIPQRWPRAVPVKRGGRVMMVNTDKKAAAHKKAVGYLARAAMRGREPWTGPVMMSMVAVFPIPASWPKYLKEQAKAGQVPHIADPDLDRLTNQILDSCKEIVFADDNQVCSFVAPFSKRYGHPARTEVTFHLLDQQESTVTPGQRRLEKNQQAVARSIIAAKKTV